MQKPPRPVPMPVRILLIALFVFAWLAALLMYVVDDLGDVPLMSLPLSFWLLLFSGPALLSISVLVWGFTPLEGSIASTSSFGIFFTGCLALLVAFLNNLLESQTGGATALALAVGSICLAFAFSTYKRSRALK